MDLADRNKFPGRTDKSRRAFLSTAAKGFLFTLAGSSTPFRIPFANKPIRALAFDGFAIFDPRPVYALTEKLFPGKGKEIAELWRLKQFEYSWLRAVGNQYKDFWQITGEALVFATRKMQVDLSVADKERLMNGFLTLDIWPDVLPLLQSMKQKGIRLAFLSNMSPRMLNSCILHNKLNEYFEFVLSTDQLRTYKPSQVSYEMATRAFGLEKTEILFVAFAGWDAAGAKWFGYPTYWVNRLGNPAEELDVMVDKTSRTLDEISGIL